MNNADRLLLWAAYAAYLLVYPALLGLAINLIRLRMYKRAARPHGAPQNAIVLTHHQWLLNTAIATLVFAVVAVATWFYAFGIVVTVLVTIWWFYRVIRGGWYLFQGKPAPVIPDD